MSLVAPSQITLLATLSAGTLSACTVPNPNAGQTGEESGSGSESETESGSESEAGSESGSESSDESAGGVCGNGIAEGDEACDEGEDNDDNSACKSDCTLAECGDGFVGPDETCDAGPANADSGECTTACRLAACGDMFIGPDETCDDGESNADSAACKADCTINICGDAAVGPGEECDDGNEVETDACRTNCRSVDSLTCAAGSQTAGEWCLEAPESSTTMLGDAFAWGVLDVDEDNRQDLVLVDGGSSNIRWMLGAQPSLSVGQELDLNLLSFNGFAGPVVVGQFAAGGPDEVVLFSPVNPDSTVRVFATATTGPDLIDVAGAVVSQFSDYAPTHATKLVQQGGGDPVALGYRSNDTTVAVMSALGTTATFELPVAPLVLRAADFGSGERDTLVSLDTQPPQQLRVLKPNGPLWDEVQAIAMQESPGGESLKFEVSDLDKDGFDDVLATSARDCAGPDTTGCTESVLQIWQGSAAAEPLSYLGEEPVGFGALVFAVADFNVDGFDDIVIARQATQDLLFLETDGSGAVFPFSRTVPMAQGADPVLIPGDFNGDGTPDLIVHNGDSNTSQVLWSNP